MFLELQLSLTFAKSLFRGEGGKRNWEVLLCYCFFGKSAVCSCLPKDCCYLGVVEGLCTGVA